jgi:hypothetical protein
VKDFFELTNLRALPTLGRKGQALYKLFAAYIHTIPLEELIESVERARLGAKLHYVVYGAACSYCLARPNGLKDRICGRLRLSEKSSSAQTLSSHVTSILAGRAGA